jgi:hypothetical protein
MEESRNFDPVSFTVVPPRRFEDLRVGDVFRAPSRTVTDAHAAAFQTVSADHHPIHYDVEYARRHGHTAPVVHGLQVFAFTAPGATHGWRLSQRTHLPAHNRTCARRDTARIRAGSQLL